MSYWKKKSAYIIYSIYKYAPIVISTIFARMRDISLEGTKKGTG